MTQNSIESVTYKCHSCNLPLASWSCSSASVNIVVQSQLVKMQAENAQEWAMREKLSSEKLALERENKRMRNEITRLDDELHVRSRPPATAIDIDVKTLQDELAAKTKVFCLVCYVSHVR